MWAEVLGETILCMSPFILMALVAGICWTIDFIVRSTKNAKRNSRRFKFAIASAIDAFIDCFNQEV